jgi:hypothetical protein
MVPVLGVEAVHDVLKPEIGLLHGLVERIEAGAHGLTPFEQI